MYDNLEIEIHKNEIEIVEMDFKGNHKGLYADNVIAIDKNIKSDKEKRCILVEELGHHFTTFGNIHNKQDIVNVKQEKKARNWGYEKLVGIIDIIDAFNASARNRYEIAEYLNVTEEFLDASIQHYREKYGVYFEIDDYIIYFEPNFGILKKF